MADSNLKCNTREPVDHLEGRTVVKRFPRTIVQHRLDLCNPSGADRPEIVPFREPVADQTVGVLVCTTLPRGVGVGEVRPASQRRVHLCEARELLAVVRGNGPLEHRRQAAQQRDNRGGHRDGLLVAHLADQHHAALTFDQRHQQPRTLGPLDRVRLPVIEPASVFHRGRTPFDAHASRNLAALPLAFANVSATPTRMAAA